MYANTVPVFNTLLSLFYPHFLNVFLQWFNIDVFLHRLMNVIVTRGKCSADSWFCFTKPESQLPRKPFSAFLLSLWWEMTDSSFRLPLKQWSSFTCQLAEQILPSSLLLRPFIKKEPALSRPPVCPPSMKKRTREGGGCAVEGRGTPSSNWKSPLDFLSKEYWFIGPKQSLL